MEIEAPGLPLEHKAEITYRCVQKHAIKVGGVKAVCENGKITFYPAVAAPCLGIGELYDLMFRNARNVSSEMGTVESILVFSNYINIISF